MGSASKRQRVAFCTRFVIASSFIASLTAYETEEALAINYKKREHKNKNKNTAQIRK